MAGNIGMMNEAYFLSKATLLEWVNTFLQSSIEKVEHLATGACYCNLFDGIHPKTIPMSKVDFSVKYDYEYSKNWKLLQNAFEKVGIKKQIPVERLTKARYQDNLEFLQWFYKYAHDSYPGDCDNPDYDAITARMRSKGGNNISNNNNNNHPRLRNNNNNNKMSRVGKENIYSNARPPSARSHSNYQNNKYNNNNNNNNNNIINNNNHGSSSSLGSMRGYRGQNGQNVGRRGGNNNNMVNNNNNNDIVEDSGVIKELETLREENNKLVLNNETLKKQLESVTNDHTELRTVAKDIEKERDFYFNKVLEVETICKGHNDQSLPLLTKIYNILYATEEDGNDNNNNNNENGNENESMNANNSNNDINSMDVASIDNPMNDIKNEMVNQQNTQFGGQNGIEDVSMNSINAINTNNMMQM